jgi:hypothetical protein
MIRSAIAQAVPAVSTAAVMLYYQPRKGWTWAIPAGLAAHFVSGWAVNKMLAALEGLVTLPVQPVALSNGQVQVPALENPAQFHGTPESPFEAPVTAPTSKEVEVLDRNDNVIKLPTAMGEP